MKSTLFFIAIFLVAAFSLAGQELAQPDAGWGEYLEGQEVPGGVAHGRVRLTGGADAALRARLVEEGVRLGVSLGDGWYAVAVEVARARAAVLAELGVAPVPEEEKLSEDLRRGEIAEWARTESRGQVWVDVDVVFHREAGMAVAEAQVVKLGGVVLERAEYFERLRARVPVGRLKELAGWQWVRAVETMPAPAREMSNATSAMLMGVDGAREEFGVKGNGVRVAVLDSAGVDTHPDLSGRVLLMGPTSVSRHATHVAGTIAGSGQSDAGLKGMAPEAQILSYDFYGDVSMKMLRARTEMNAAVVNNSWGAVVSEGLGNCNSYGTYGVQESELDRIVRNEGLAIVFSIGNDRNDGQCNIAPRGGFHTVGRPGAAKNVLTVGAVNGATAASEFGGYGPGRDGRLKPELTALGVDVRSLDLGGGAYLASGTSMSAPAVTGLVALLTEQYKREHSGASPEPALLKALLLNTAKDLGNPGPDYTHGYGLPDAKAALGALGARRFARGAVAQEEVKEFEIEVPAGTPVLRVLAAWDDHEGWPGGWRALVNDLDLEVVSPEGEVVLPLTLNWEQPAADAAPGVNRRDNAEQVVVRAPAAGVWKVRVKGTEVLDEQGFVVTWNFADMPAPECLTTITPSELEVAAEGGTQVLAVTRPNACGEWRGTSEVEWVRPADDRARQGTVAVKVKVDPNLETLGRETVLEVADRAVAVKQAPACAVTPITFGERLTSGLTEFDCLDSGDWYMRVYEFEAQAGQAISASLDSDDFDAYLILVDPSGGLLASNDDASAATTNSRIPVAGGLVLPATGVYQLLVSSYFPRETGMYEVELREETPPSAAAPRKPVEACPAEIYGELSVASGRDGRRGDLFPVEAYVFRGRLGQKLVVELHDAEFDSVLYLIDPQGRQVAFNDDAESGEAASRIELALPASGVFRLEVSGFSPQDMGRFRLLMEGCDPLEP